MSRVPEDLTTPPKWAPRRTEDHAQDQQAFLAEICWHYEDAARTLLQWYAQDAVSAAEFLAGFLVRLHHNIHVDTCYFVPREGVVDGLRSPGISVCRDAFLRFCELLYETPALIGAVQAAYTYQRGIGDADFFKNRESNPTALTRDGWETKGLFANPTPLPRDVIERFREDERLKYELAELQRRRAEEIKNARKAARRAAIGDDPCGCGSGKKWKECHGADQ